MREKPNHQYNSILFADMVGYTSLMQRDEQAALRKLQKFKHHIETITPNYQGTIIQFYGDGCLVVFEEAVLALSCAKALQLAFREKPLVPVRIGLHAGEVVYREGNVFGHAVNIASRVESMGISGAILMTNEIKKTVGRLERFQLKYIGDFQLKNVKEQVAIYALANQGFSVPDKATLAQKANTLSKGNTQNSRLIKLVIALLATIIGFFVWQNLPSAEIDPQTLKERIAVLPFKNNTNDPNLEVFGNMAADWINTGLMEVEDAEVVSPFTVRTHESAIGILEHDPQDRPSFAALTGAKNLISGNYYQDGKDLIFKLELVDAEDGRLLFSFKEIKETAANRKNLLAKLRKQVTGYWAARDLVSANKINPPNFEAYELYLENLQKRGTEEELQAILALDSTFYLPRIHYLNIITGSMQGAIEPHIRFLDRHMDELSEYEYALFSYIKGLYLGNPKGTFESLNSVRQKYPKDFLLNHACADIALNGLHNATLALKVYHELPLKEEQAGLVGVYWNERLLNMVSCYVELNRLDEVQELLAVYQPNPQIDNNVYIKTRLIGALASNNQDNIDQAYAELVATVQTKPFHYFWVNLELIQSSLLSDEFRRQQESDFVSNYNQLAANSRERILVRNFIPLITNKGKVEVSDLKDLPTGIRIGNLAAAGQFYINNQQYGKVEAIIAALQALTTCSYKAQIQTTCAAASYYIGQFYAQIDQPEKAIEYLKKAKELGFGNELHRFQYSRYFSTLFDLPAFQALIQPIWPSANTGEIIVRAVNQYNETSEKSEDITAEFQKESLIKLEAYNQFVEVKLGLTNNYQKQQIDYLYQLENLDRDWLMSDKEVITIGNLPYGEQKLRIKAQFPDGRFGEKILEIPIIRTKPFYLNIWFVCILLFAIFGGVFLLPNLIKTDSTLKIE